MDNLPPPISQLRLRLDGDALQNNYRALAKASGSAQTGAAVKANGYGLGVHQVVKLLDAAGCREFFVAHWKEALEISQLVDPARISVLCGVADADMPLALALGAVPMLNTPQQIKRWKMGGGGRCHIMFDSGINRLGIGAEQLDASLFEELDIDILASHLASADEDSPQNAAQLGVFTAAISVITARRRSLANSAGIMLGGDYHFDLTRPGLSLYGGIARPELADIIQQVAYIQSNILQIREHAAGDKIGYNATYICDRDMRIATCSLGYADGYLRGFSNIGMAHHNGAALPIIGRVSMDLITLDIQNAPHLSEGDWIDIDYDLTKSSHKSGLSQYELLTGLGNRFDRHWA